MKGAEWKFIIFDEFDPVNRVLFVGDGAVFLFPSRGDIGVYVSGDQVVCGDPKG